MLRLRYVLLGAALAVVIHLLLGLVTGNDPAMAQAARGRGLDIIDALPLLDRDAKPEIIKDWRLVAVDRTDKKDAFNLWFQDSAGHVYRMTAFPRNEGLAVQPQVTRLPAVP